MQFCLLALIAILASSCKREELKDVLSTETFPNVSLAIQDKVEVAAGTNFTLTSGEVTIPITVNFSGASPKAFTVQLAANTDTVASLVTSGALPVGTVALQEGTFNFPPVVNVAFGVKSVTFDLLVSRSFMERNYGKDLALALKMTDAAKGNSITAGKNATVVLIKTGLAIAADQVHYINFNTSSVLLPVTTFANSGSQDVSIFVPIVLTGLAGPTFTVDVAARPDTVTTLISNGTYPNLQLLDAANYSMPAAKVRFEAGKNNAVVQVVLKRSSLAAAPAGKNLAIALTLRNPSLFQTGTGAGKKTVILTFDPKPFKPYNGTPFIIPAAIGQASVLIPAAQYDFGGEGFAFHDDGNKDGVGDYRSPDKVDVGDYTPRTVVGWTNNNEWLTFSVFIEAAGEYEMNAIIGAPGTNGRYSVLIDDTTNDKANRIHVAEQLTPNQTPGAYGDQKANLSTVTLPQGLHILKFYMNVGAYDVRGLIFTRKK